MKVNSKLERDCVKSHLHFAKNCSNDPSSNPVDNLYEGDDAEAETEAKEAAKRGDKVHRTHPDAPLHF